ncbi:photosystem II reaction center protein Psb28 [Leptolyngbya sp. AN02str]|uniref:photosystem II reaction center protein Psb28 n=1 Tax=Leptolyngbya sp. AN02str TaxID=3423363 RepID=UPI003D3106F0
MTSIPTLEFYDGVPEELTGISLRRNRNTGTRIMVLSFSQLKAIERFNSFTQKFNKALKMTDSEGAITIEPSSIQFIFGGDEGDEIQRIDCKLEVDREEHWERLMRFMHRYAEANGMEYGESSPG